MFWKGKALKSLNISHNGKTQSLTAWAKELGISRQAMSLRIKQKRPVSEIFYKGKLPSNNYKRSRKINIQPGYKRGFLTFTGRESHNQRNERIIQVKCDCGKVLWRSLYFFLSSKNPNCKNKNNPCKKAIWKMLARINQEKILGSLISKPKNGWNYVDYGKNSNPGVKNSEKFK